ncbi:hypothetical protein NUM25_003844 [Salmonella enterica]|nr:hypothetical protein [Salmonella enterica]
MLSNIREVHKRKTVPRRNYIIDDFTQDMILLLPKSPKSFLHVMTLAVSEAFQFTENEIHAAIQKISTVVTEDVLSKQLENITRSPVVELTRRPNIDPDVLTSLNDNDVHIAMILARHLYGDLSETNSATRIESQNALTTGVGKYVTHFIYQAHSIRVETTLPECSSRICLV